MAAGLRWSDAALDDLAAIRAGLTAESAKRVGRIIVDAVDCLLEFPERGRPGIAAATRELPLPGLPWWVVYGPVAGGGVMILRLLDLSGRSR